MNFNQHIGEQPPFKIQDLRCTIQDSGPPLLFATHTPRSRTRGVCGPVSVPLPDRVWRHEAEFARIGVDVGVGVAMVMKMDGAAIESAA